VFDHVNAKTPTYVYSSTLSQRRNLLQLHRTVTPGRYRHTTDRVSTTDYPAPWHPKTTGAIFHGLRDTFEAAPTDMLAHTPTTLSLTAAVGTAHLLKRDLGPDRFGV